MARKYGFCRQHGLFILYSGLVAGLGAALLTLQQLCMSNGDNAFVSSVCMSDSNTRALIAAILTGIISTMNRATVDAINAYRVAQLSSGIAEGVYVAMGSANPFYRFRSLATRWWLVMLIIIVSGHTPASLQTIANLLISSSSVYVRNQSTAMLYTGRSYYNVTGPVNSPDAVSQAVGSVIPPRVMSQLPQQNDLRSAFHILDQGLSYTSIGSSTRTPDGRVHTAVLRSGYIPRTNLKAVDVSDAIRRPETVALVSSLCATECLNASAARELLTSTSVQFNVTTSDGAGYLVVFDTVGTVSPDGSLQFDTSLYAGACLGCASPGSGLLLGNRTSCSTVIRFEEHEIIFKLSTGGVTPDRLLKRSTTVEAAVAVLFIPGFILSVLKAPDVVNNVNLTLAFLEGIADTNFIQGYFDTGAYNYMHATLCSAVSQTLGRLWAIAQPNVSMTAVPLYSLQVQTYVSGLHVALLVALVTFATLVVCGTGMAYSHWSPINIKDATENALVECFSKEAVDRKRANPTTNDPAKQRELAFEHTDGHDIILYCREDKYTDANGVDIVKVSISYDPGDKKHPDKSTDYL